MRQRIAEAAHRTAAARLGVYLALQGAMGALFLLTGDHAADTFPLDDAYIHHVYAEGIAYGDGFAYNPGVPASGCTSPLWAATLSLLHRVGLGASVLATKLLGLFFGGVAAFLTDRLTARLTPNLAWVAGALVVLDPPLTFGAVSGMEVPLAAALVLAGLLALERPAVAGLAFAAASATRPELTVLPLLAAGMAGHRRREHLAWLLAPTALMWCGWCAWNLYATGALLPTTFYAKHPPMGPFAQWRDLHIAYLSLLGGPLLAVVGAPFIGLAIRHRRVAGSSPRAALVLAITAVMPLALGWAHDLRELEFYWTRYALPLRPCLLVLVALGVGALAKWRGVAMLWLSAGLVAAGVRANAEHANNCRNVYELDVRAAQWVREHSTERDWIAANDAGAMRVVGHRRVVDLLGLNDHRMLGPEREAVLHETRPRYLVVFPSWFPRLAERYPVAARFRSVPYTICTRCDQSELLVLRAH